MAAASRQRRPRIGLASAAVAIAVLLTSLALLALGRMTEDEATATAPDGAELTTIPSENGAGLSARLWTLHPARIAVLLHGFAGDQHDWDEAIQPLQDTLKAPISVLTFDFRGHGQSPGENRDLVGMTADVRSAIDYARSRGFSEIVLIGASMGGTAAIVAAAEGAPIAGVIAISAPAELGGLDALAAVRSVESPLSLIAAVEDASAAESFRRLRNEAGDGAAMAVMYPGRAHGIALIEGSEVRGHMARTIDALWAKKTAAE